MLKATSLRVAFVAIVFGMVNLLSAAELAPYSTHKEMQKVTPGTPYRLTIPLSGGSGTVLVGSRDHDQRLYAQTRNNFDASVAKQELVVDYFTDPLAREIEVIVMSANDTVNYDAVKVETVNLSNLPPDPLRPEQEIWVHVDFYDMLYYAPDLGLETYTEADIVKMFERLKEHGTTGVVWRVSLLGQMLYHSKGASTMPPGNYPVEKMEPGMLRAVEAMKKYDPLAVAVREARKHGMQIMIMVTVDDEANWESGPWWSQFIIDHPGAGWVDRNGTPQWGTLCYSNPLALKYRLDQVKELIEYKTDGIYYSFRFHGATHNSLETGERYGYNPEIVKKYKERFDVDITQHPASEGRVLYLDTRRWNEIKAESYDLLLERTAELVHAANQKLMIDITSAMHRYREGQFGSNSILNYDLWLQNRWVDSVVVGIWLQSPSEIFMQGEKIRAMLYPDQKFYYWIQLNNYANNIRYPAKDMLEQMHSGAWARGNGWLFHEYYDFEQNMKYFEEVLPAQK